MIASLRHRFVFLHLPKNAGTAIRHAIQEAFSGDSSLVEGWGVDGGHDLAHPLPAVMRKRFPAVYEMLGEETTRSVAVLRDPLPRCIAAFREHRHQFGEHPDGCDTLAEYLDHIEEGHYRAHCDRSCVFIHGAPQWEHLFDEGRLLVRHLLRLDDRLFFPKLCMAMGVTLPHLELTNASCEVPGYVNREDVRRILRIYEKDYELMDSLPTGAA